jgi:hypothetical protein
VPATAEVRREKGVDYGTRATRGHDPAPEGQDVRTVVLARQFGGLAVQAERRSHAVHLVGRDLFALTAAAENDPDVGVTRHDRASHRRAKRWVIDRLLRTRSEIDHLMAPFLQVNRYVLLEHVPGVIGSKGNPHRRDLKSEGPAAPGYGLRCNSVTAMPKSWDALLPRLRELTDLEQALRLLHWDQAVMMPRRGAAGRARAVATLEAIAHDRLTDPALGDLLEELSSEGSLDDVQRASVRVLRRDYEQATKVPRDLVAAMAEARGLAYQAWTEARPASDYSIAATHLSRLIALKRQEADALGWEDERYDALLDLWEPGLRTKDVSGMFSELKAGLKPIVEAVTARAGEAPEFVKASFAEGSQMAFCEWLVEHVGFEPSGCGRSTRRSTRPVTLSTSRGCPTQCATSPPAVRHRWVCTSRSRGSGRTR